jgi:dual specificity phosphatase 12
VLSICSDFVPAEDRTLGIVHYRIPIPDETFTDLLVHLPAACAFISAALAQGRNVLVHSLRGQNRAPAVIAAYCKTLLLPSAHLIEHA